MKQRACIPCTKSKRQCNRAFPACRRCRERAIRCEYPSMQSAAATVASAAAVNDIDFVNQSSNNYMVDYAGEGHLDPLPGETPVADYPSLVLPILPLEFNAIALSNSPPVPFIHDSQISHTVISEADTLWFLSPTSWKITHSSLRRTGPPSRCYDNESITFAVKEQTNKWMRQWISDGHAPFIHRKLYDDRNGMPRCIQDAYTAVVSYFQKGAGTEQMIVRIINDRMSQLIEDCGDINTTISQPFGMSERDTVSTSSIGFSGQANDGERPNNEHLSSSVPTTTSDTLSVVDHLARVQSLLVYQSIRLFDGNIRMRSEAEQHISTLSEWADRMYNAATTELEWKPNLCDDEGSLSCDIILSNCWRLWILAESVRRTWLAAKILEGVYLNMKKGWSECPGGICFTARSGIWEQSSAYSWYTACYQGRSGEDLNTGQLGDRQEASRPLFIRNTEASWVFSHMRATEVDDFSRLVLSITYGLEAVERWTTRYNNRASSHDVNMSLG